MSGGPRARSRATALLALALLAAPAAGAAGSDVRLSVTETLLSEYRLDVDDALPGDADNDYLIGVNRLNMIGSSGGLSTSLRADTILFDDPASEPLGPAYRNDMRLERLSARYRLGDWELEAGDFYRQLGRGLILGIRKIDELGVDVTIRGGQLGWRGKELSAGAFAGYANPANLDTVDQKFLGDTDDAIVGANLAFQPSFQSKVEAFGVYVEPTEPPGIIEDESTAAVGLAAEWRSAEDSVALYAEGAFQQVTRDEKTTDGNAAYLTADIFLTDDLLLLVEAAWMESLGINGSTNQALGTVFAYNRPPTLERIDQEVRNLSDVMGGRLKLEQSLSEGDTVVYVNGLYRILNPGDDLTRQNHLHAYAGFEHTYQLGGSHLYGSGGWRDESQDEEGKHLKGMVHFELDWLQRLAPAWALLVSSQNEFRTDGDASYRRGSVFLGAEKASAFGLTFEYGYDTQNPNTDNHFFAGILSWHATERIQLRATGGSQRGGLKCVAGVCRIFPEFKGARMELVARL